MISIIGGGRGEIGRADRGHLRSIEIEGRRLRVSEAPLPPVDTRREERHREHDERDAQAQAELCG